MIQEDIYSVLSSSPVISSICGERIFPKRMPQKSAVPAIVYTINDITPVKSLTGESGLDNGDVEIICWAQNYTAAHRLASAVRAAFVASGIAVLTGNIQDVEDEETHNFGVLMNMSAWSASAEGTSPQNLNNPMKNEDFYFVAAEGQTQFTLARIYKDGGFFALWINGTGQSKAKTPTPDFVVSGVTLTLSQGLDEGDVVYGFYEVL